MQMARHSSRSVKEQADKLFIGAKLIIYIIFLYSVTQHFSILSTEYRLLFRLPDCHFSRDLSKVQYYEHTVQYTLYLKQSFRHWLIQQYTKSVLEYVDFNSYVLYLTIATIILSLLFLHLPLILLWFNNFSHFRMCRLLVTICTKCNTFFFFNKQQICHLENTFSRKFIWPSFDSVREVSVIDQFPHSS